MPQRLSKPPPWDWPWMWARALLGLVTSEWGWSVHWLQRTTDNYCLCFADVIAMDAQTRPTCQATFTLVCFCPHRFLASDALLHLIRQIPSLPCKPRGGNCLGDTFPGAPRPGVSSLLLPPCYPWGACCWSWVNGPISQVTGFHLRSLYTLALGRELAS